MNKISVQDLRLVSKVLQDRFKLSFKKAMSKTQKSDLEQRIRKHFEDDQLVLEKETDGRLKYFIISHFAIMTEFNEQFFHVADMYCCPGTSVRREFYGRLKKISKMAAKERSVKRMIISVAADDKISLKHFGKKGMLTYVELYGEVKKSLSILKREKNLPKGITFTRLKKTDIAPLVKLDIDAHLKEPTSRMREIFSKPAGKKLMKDFYRDLLKNKTCLVARFDNKLVGSVAWFVDKRNRNGLVASIFVADKYKGKGISKILYKRLLEEFAKKNLTHYIGSSTTGRVLELAQRLKRIPGSHAYILKI
jgi:GNAT superfamily N-acetyltransferase